jgi:hypothetical protein
MKKLTMMMVASRESPTLMPLWAVDGAYPSYQKQE